MRTKERIKTLLLCVLLIGAVFLTYSIWFYDSPTADGLLTNLWKNSEYEYNDETLTELMLEESAAEIVPFAISYRNEKGYFGAAYHGESVNRLYQKTVAILREALSTVSDVDACIEKDWQTALRAKGILYDFEGVVPLAALALQTGAENADRFTAFGRYLLFAENNFYIKNPSTGECFRLQHGLNAAELRRVMDGMSAAKCTLALEAGNRKIAPETPIFEEAISAFSVNGYNPVSFFSEEQMLSLLKVFGMNYNTCGKYTEKDGTQVYIEDLNVLKIASDGYITYSNEHGDEDAQGGIIIASTGDIPTQTEILQAANGMIARLSYLAGGNGATYMQNVMRQEEKATWVLRFGWSFGGIPIDRQKTGYCAEISVNGKRITGVGFYMRSYESAGSIIGVVPQKLAVAAVNGDKQGALGLRYTDGGGSGLIPHWYVKMK